MSSEANSMRIIKFQAPHVGAVSTGVALFESRVEVVESRSQELAVRSQPESVRHVPQKKVFKFILQGTPKMPKPLPDANYLPTQSLDPVRIVCNCGCKDQWKHWERKPRKALLMFRDPNKNIINARPILYQVPSGINLPIPRTMYEKWDLEALNKVLPGLKEHFYATLSWVASPSFRCKIDSCNRICSKDYEWFKKHIEVHHATILFRDVLSCPWGLTCESSFKGAGSIFITNHIIDEHLAHVWIPFICGVCGEKLDNSVFPGVREAEQRLHLEQILGHFECKKVREWIQ